MIARPVLVLVLALCVPLIVGAVLLVVSEPGSALYILGFAIGGVAAILLVAVAFYAVGRSEDRAREADARRRRDPHHRG